MRYIKLLVVLALILAALAVPVLIFFSRTPVLVVTDIPFVALYGEDRLQQQQRSASLSLFRQVKPLLVADGASPDMLVVAITEAAENPWCVLFPRSQALAAQRYHEQFPETSVVLLGGHVPASSLPVPDGFLCVYGTDSATDLYRAGLFAGILGKNHIPAGQVQHNEAAGEFGEASIQRTVALWQDRHVQAAGRELFSRGVQEEAPEAAVVFVNLIAEVPDTQRLVCMVLTSAGAEFLGKSPKMPLILFTWLDPALTSRQVAVIFDDSIWSVAVPAVRLAKENQPSGNIPSKPLIFSGKIADNGVIRLLQKSAKKTP
ncbi:MAG: hypothetical protein FWD36_04370 [Treponema sp.]|nr:hypothetical protein [Treponema sp.]